MSAVERSFSLVFARALGLVVGLVVFAGCGGGVVSDDVAPEAAEKTSYGWLSQGYCSLGMSGETENVDASGYSFFVDGIACRPAWVFTKEPSRQPSEGDVVEIGVHNYVVGPPGEYRFDTRGQEFGDLFEMVDGRLVRRSVSVTARDNPLSGMSAEGIRDLREIIVYSWTKEIEADLAKASPERTFFDIQTLSTSSRLFFENGALIIEADKERQPLPVLPPGLRYLSIDEQVYGVQSGFALIGEQHDLEYLKIKSSSGAFDMNLLIHAKDLKFLALFDMEIFNLRAFYRLLSLQSLDLSGQEEGMSDLCFLSGVSTLRTLNLSDVRRLSEISTVKELPNLQRLYLANTGDFSLEPIGSLHNLEVLDITHSGAFGLPIVEMPSLRRISALGSGLSEENVREFRKLNPNCDLVFGFVHTLEQRILGADKLTVHEMAKGKGNLNQREVISTVVGVDAVAAIVEMIEIDDRSSRYLCGCIGSPWLSFYRDDEELATVAVHHGRTLRWSEWPAHGVLEDGSAEKLNNWLASLGITHPKEEWESVQQMKLKRAALEAFYEKTIPPEILSRMRSFIKRMKDAERGRGELTEEEGFSLLDEFKKGSRLWSDLDISEDEAIAMLLTALGAENRSWKDSDNLAVMIAEIVLPSFSQNARAFAQACSLAPSSACAGLARWLFRFGRLKELDTAAVEKALPHIWRTMAEHPDQRDRHTVIAALGEIGTETALGLLRDLVKSDLSQSPSYNARDDEPETQIPDAVHAASALASAGDESSLPVMRALLEKLSEAQGKAIVEKAIANLQ